MTNPVLSYARRLSPFFYYTPLMVAVTAWYLATANQWGHVFVYATLIYILGVISLLDILVGPTEEGIYEPLSTRELKARTWIYRGILISTIPIYAVMSYWGCYVYATHHLTVVEKIVWVFSMGILTTLFAHDAAHELIHKTDARLQMLGGVLFGLALYGGAKVSHIRSHHVLVATPDDATTARFGQSVYAFLPGALWVNTWTAWKIQQRVLAQRGAGLLSARNEMLFWTLISAAVLLFVYRVFGLETLCYYLGQCFIGASFLEMCNYAGHYGLERQQLSNGQYERVSLRHAWNCNFIFNNLISLNVQRHPDHHKHGPRDYQLLRSFGDSPQLPQGYTVLAFFVFIPPLWRWYMHPHLERAMASWGQIHRSA